MRLLGDLFIRCTVYFLGAFLIMVSHFMRMFNKDDGRLYGVEMELERVFSVKSLFKKLMWNEG